MRLPAFLRRPASPVKCERGGVCADPGRCELLGCLAPRSEPKPPSYPTQSAVQQALAALPMAHIAAEIARATAPKEPAPVSTENAPQTAAQNSNGVWSPAPGNAAKPRNRDIRVVSVPLGGFVLVEDNAPVAVGIDSTGIAAALARLLG
jgi:hypothetical protein